MAKMTRIRYRNTFHRTEAIVRVQPSDVRHMYDELVVRLSKRQQRRVERTLCGMQDCSCSGSHSNFHPTCDDTGWCYGGEVVQ